MSFSLSLYNKEFTEKIHHLQSLIVSLKWSSYRLEQMDFHEVSCFALELIMNGL